jgi:inward rectifier potassium channel
VAVVAPREGVPTLMFRVANERVNHVVEAQLRVAMVRSERTKEGEFLRRIVDIPLVRSQSPAFVLTWTALHPITAESPLYGETQESLAEKNAEIIVTLLGIDEVLSQTIHARFSYVASDLVFGKRFADIIPPVLSGQRVVDYRRFHEVVPLEDGKP